MKKLKENKKVLFGAALLGTFSLAYLYQKYKKN